MNHPVLTRIKNDLKAFVMGDRFYLHDDVNMSCRMSHNNWKEELIKLANENHWRVLELGSRAVVFGSYFRSKMTEAEYVGFDYYPGENVDVVGDAHKLSSYFKNEEKFDLIFSSAVFEHLAMPWLVSEEISKMLKVGGYVFTETHYCYSSHERPWHFFQFSEQALKVLFNEHLGFECIEAGVSNPIVGRFSKFADKYLRGQKVTGMYCHSEFFGKKVKEADTFDWHEMDLGKIYSGTEYVKPKKKKNFIKNLFGILFNK